MKLYATINDRDGTFEKVILCQFKDKNGNNVFIEEEYNGRFDIVFFKVLLDTGYCCEEYYYPVDRYTIVRLEIYK